MQMFLMQRKGETVAEGVVFSDGRVAIRWQSDDKPSSTVTWDCLADAHDIHNHDGQTEFVMSDHVAWPPKELRPEEEPTDAWGPKPTQAIWER